MKLKKMDWDEKVWVAFKRASAYIPPIVRMEAVLGVIEESEREARKRGSKRVMEKDLVVATKRKVPRAYKRVSLEILEEQGITIEENKQ